MISFDGSTDYLVSTNSFDADLLSDGASEWSAHWFCRSPNAATTGNSPIWRFENATTNCSTGYVWDGGAANIGFYRDSGGTYQVCGGGTGSSANTWYSKGIRWYFSNTFTRCIIGVTNGSSFGGADCGSAWPAAETGCYLYIGGEGTNFFEGDLEHFAVWNVELTNNDFIALASGVSPLLVRPQNLIWYFPFVNGYQELISGTELTVNGSPSFTSGGGVEMTYPADPMFFARGSTPVRLSQFPTEVVRIGNATLERLARLSQYVVEPVGVKIDSERFARISQYVVEVVSHTPRGHPYKGRGSGAGKGGGNKNPGGGQGGKGNTGAYYGTERDTNIFSDSGWY